LPASGGGSAHEVVVLLSAGSLVWCHHAWNSRGHQISAARAWLGSRATMSSQRAWATARSGGWCLCLALFSLATCSRDWLACFA